MDLISLVFVWPFLLFAGVGCVGLSMPWLMRQSFVVVVPDSLRHLLAMHLGLFMVFAMAACLALVGYVGTRILNVVCCCCCSPAPARLDPEWLRKNRGINVLQM